jgi:hypothetical protein
MRQCVICGIELIAKPRRARTCSMKCNGLLRRSQNPHEQRFWSKVDKRGPDECWPWKANTGDTGYGMFWSSDKKTMVKANREAYRLSVGDPGTLHVLHRCDNPGCCNPAHLFLGTHQENMTDMVHKKRQWRGAQKPAAKLTEQAVADIRKRYSFREVTIGMLATEYGVAERTLWKALHGIGWYHVETAPVESRGKGVACSK